MSSRKSLSLVAAVILSGIVAFGGGGAVASAAGRRDVRSQTVLSPGAPQSVVAGPARLLHVDFEGGRTVSLFSVDSRSGGPDACRTGLSTAKRSALRANVRNALDLDVAAGRTVCLVADGGSVQVAWHAQAASAPQGAVGGETVYAGNR